MKTMIKPIVTKVLADIDYKGDPIVEFYKEGCCIKFNNPWLSKFAVLMCLVAEDSIFVRIINYRIENYLIKNGLSKSGEVYSTKLYELADIRHSANYWELIKTLKNLNQYSCWKKFIETINKKKYYWWNYIFDWHKY